MSKSFQKKCMTFDQFKKYTNDTSTTGTDGDIKSPDSIKHTDRKIKQIQVNEMNPA